MGCLKGESEVEKKEAKFECSKCGALVGKKSHICKPVKLSGGKKSAHKCKCDKNKKKK